MTTAAPLDDRAPERWRMLALLSVSQLLGMSLWFAGSAAAPRLAEAWTLSQAQAGWLTTIVQLGFVLGTATAALLNLADIVPSRWYFAACATAASLANLVVLNAASYPVALTGRFLTGVFLAGVYPPAMKMAATWFRARRGLAIGTVVGALTVGKASPYLVQSLPGAGTAATIGTASVLALLGAGLISLLYRDGPYPFPPRPFSWALAGTVVRTREWRLATGGYLGHMFELYSFWTWIPLFVGASLLAAGAEPSGGMDALVSLTAFGAIAVGGAGAVWGGLAADRKGRERLVMIAMAASGACALVTPAVFGGPLWLLVPLAWAWGFYVIADSAQFSALVTESVPPHAVGTALTIQVSIGFLLTMVSIQLVPPLVALIGWRWAFPMLALGPALGILAIRRLLRVRAAARSV